MSQRNPAAMAEVRFTRLPDVALDDVLALLNEPRNARHMPLSATFDMSTAQAWVEAKDAQWYEYGYGPWAVLVDDEFAGWGGFQREPNGADFALVLHPHHWGQGAAITSTALRLGFTDLNLQTVLIALPKSRNPGRVVQRLGFLPDGDVTYSGITFRQYRLTKSDWEDLLRKDDDIHEDQPDKPGPDRVAALAVLDSVSIVDASERAAPAPSSPASSILDMTSPSRTQTS